MEHRAEKFDEGIHGVRDQIRSVLATLHNLDTLMSYYLEWLANAGPKEFNRFRVPFTPEALSAADVTDGVAKQLSKLLQGDGSVPADTELNSIGLFVLLQSNGIVADTPDIERALHGTAGLGLVNDSSKVPASRFTPPATRDALARVRVFIYVFPQAVTMGNVAAEYAAPLGPDPGVMVSVESTGQRALFNLRTQNWVAI